MGNIKRVFSYEEISEAVNQRYPFGDINPTDWLKEPHNIALKNDKGDVSLFQYSQDKVFIGHYFFFSRGREAITAAEEFLEELFTKYHVEVIQGWTPLLNRKARWMSKRLGFKSYGVIHAAEACELFIMTKQEWKQKYG